MVVVIPFVLNSVILWTRNWAYSSKPQVLFPSSLSCGLERSHPHLNLYGNKFLLSKFLVSLIFKKDIGSNTALTFV